MTSDSVEHYQLSENERRFLDSVQQHYNLLATEAKKKHPHIKEACETGIIRVRNASSPRMVAGMGGLRQSFQAESQQILEPFFMACDTRILKMVQISIAAIQKLILFDSLDKKASSNLLHCLWALMENGLEEVKILQTITLLVTTSAVVTDEQLSRVICLCFRLCASKNPIIKNTSLATIRQLVTVIFDRVQKDLSTPQEDCDENKPQSSSKLDECFQQPDSNDDKDSRCYKPVFLKASSLDAFNFFQDLIQLINDEKTFWLKDVQLDDQMKSFTLELLELILDQFDSVFFKKIEYGFLLKERVCQIVIKLFSPTLKQRGSFSAIFNPLLPPSVNNNNNNSHGQNNDGHESASASGPGVSPEWPMTVRLMRIVSVLIKKYFSLLETENEIFFTLLVKSLEIDKQSWRRSIALEALFKMIHPELIKSVCKCYDMNNSKILRDIVNALCIYIQSQFRVVDSSTTQSLLTSLVNNNNSGTTNPQFNQPSYVPGGSLSSAPGSSVRGNNFTFPTFNLRGISISINFIPFHKGHRYRPFFLEQLEKTEPPTAPEGHGLSTAVACMLEIVSILTDIIQSDIGCIVDFPESTEFDQKLSLDSLDPDKKALHQTMLDSFFCGFMGTFLLLLDASQEEEMTEVLLQQMNKFTVFYGLYENELARDCLLLSASKAALPLNYQEVGSLSPAFLRFPPEFMPKTENDSLPNIGVLSMMKPNHTLISNAAINLPNLLTKQNSNLSSNQTSCPITSLESNKIPFQSGSGDTNRQIIAVGTPLPSIANSTSHQTQSAVMLSSKNLQCIISVLKLAAKYGRVFEERSWNILFTATQHLIWILGLKPTAQGVYQLKQHTQVLNNINNVSNAENNTNNSLITTAAMSDLPVLTTMLSRLFECSKHFDDENLLKIMRTLIALSQENSEVAFHNREPSLFPIVKILECSLINSQRIDLFWKLITDHLITVCAHPFNKLREWSVDVLCNLVKEVFSESDIKTSNSQTYYLSPLLGLSDVKFVDIRQKQIDCVLQMLQGNGEIFNDGWQCIFEIIESACSAQNENLIRCGFQSYQFIISELLKNIPAPFLSNCLNTAAVFGSQMQELNVSLTAIGLIWNIADYLHNNRGTLEPGLQRKKVATEISEKGLTVYEGLWLYLFHCLGTLCTDARLSVRKSSAQTLFSTLSTHRNDFGFALWRSIFLFNLFLILHEVEKNTSMASNERITQCESSMGNSYQTQNQDYIIHYSRNTAFKQWSETQILVLTGVTQMICQNIDMFVNKNENENFKNEPVFSNIVQRFFEFVSKNAFSSNPEVSTSSLKSFGEFIDAFIVFTNANTSVPVVQDIWRICWTTWHQMGSKCDPSKVISMENGVAGGDDSVSMDQHSRVLLSQYPSQPFLVLLMKPLSSIFMIIDDFTESDFKSMSFVLQNAVATPFLNEPSVYHYYYSSGDPRNITHLQIEVMAFLDRVQTKVLAELPKYKHLVPLLFWQYLALSLYAVNIIPPHLDVFITAQFQHRFFPGELTSFNTTSFYLLGERAMKNAYQLYQKTNTEENVVKNQILHSLIKSLKIPLCFKYSCPLQSTWKFAVGYFIKILEIGMPLARQNPDHYSSIWADLAMTFEGFLFPVNKPPTNQALEEQQLDEALDVTVVELIRDQIMLYASSIPKEFLLQIVSLLNRGSIHSPTITSSIETELNVKLREEFAKMCFQVLLRFSFFGPKGNPELFIQKGKQLSSSSPDHSIGIVNKLAVASILKRFKDVIINFCQDERICPFPLPRHRLSEISFVLKALATLVSSLKVAPRDSVEDSVWNHLIEIYPSIVDCTMSNSPQVNRSIREVLHEYSYLLRAPDPNEPLTVSGHEGTANNDGGSSSNASSSTTTSGHRRVGRNKKKNNQLQHRPTSNGEHSK